MSESKTERERERGDMHTGYLGIFTYFKSVRSWETSGLSFAQVNAVIQWNKDSRDHRYNDQKNWKHTEVSAV